MPLLFLPAVSGYKFVVNNGVLIHKLINVKKIPRDIV